MRLFFLLMLVFVAQMLNGQIVYQGIERGMSVGLAQYVGDLNPNFNMTHPNYSIGGLFKVKFSDYLSISFEGNISKIGFDDKFNKSVFEKNRNLSFESSVFDLCSKGEFNFFKFETGNFNHRWTPYLTFGIGAMIYNPYTHYQGQKIFLRPLGTEGQLHDMYADRRYSKFAAIIPVGLGLKFWLNPGSNLAFEATQRYTTTDYLDDVSTTYVDDNFFIFNSQKDISYYIQDRSINQIGSTGKQRGVSTNKDKYVLFQVKLTFIPKKYVCFRP